MNERLGRPAKKHECIKNFDGSAKSMEPAAILKMVVEGPRKGYVVDWIVSDDDSTMRAHLRHPQVEVEPANGGRGRKKKADSNKGNLRLGSVSLSSRRIQLTGTRSSQANSLTLQRKEFQNPA